MKHEVYNSLGKVAIELRRLSDQVVELRLAGRANKVDNGAVKVGVRTNEIRTEGGLGQTNQMRASDTKCLSST